MEKNRGFAFYENFWNSVENLPEPQQKEVIFAIAKYGITGEMVNPIENPIGFSMTNAFKLAIDNSVERFNMGIEYGKKGGRPNKIDGEELTMFLIQNKGISAKECAERFGVTESAIQKRPEWKNRKKKIEMKNQGDFKF